MPMNPQLAYYVCRYYDHFMHKQELLARRHLFGTAKAMKGRSDKAAQAEARSAKLRLRELFSDDPEVLQLARDGWEAFIERTATRILAEHAPDIFLNYCPRCGALANTPKARQCRACFHDWHESSSAPK